MYLGQFESLYIAKLNMKGHAFLDKCRHAIDKFLVYQRALWEELTLGAYSNVSSFVKRCKREGLGYGHMTPPSKQCLKDLVLFTSPSESHLIMYSHILLLALESARLASSTQEYLRTVVENLRRHMSPEELASTTNRLEI